MLVEIFPNRQQIIHLSNLHGTFILEAKDKQSINMRKLKRGKMANFFEAPHHIDDGIQFI